MLALLLAVTAAPPSPSAAHVVDPPRMRSGSIQSDDYPAIAIRAGEQGAVGIVLQVDERGAVTGCRVADTSRSAVLDATSCALATQRFKFVPARDAQGRAVAAEVEQRISWRLPKDDDMSDLPVPIFAAGELRLSVLQDSVGTRCAVETIGTPFERIRDQACPEAVRVAPAQLAAEPSAIMSVTIVMPGGVAAAQRQPVRGTLMGRIASDVEVAGNGHLITCRDVEVPSPDVRMPSFCQAMNLPIPAFQPDAGGQVRRGRVQMELYRLGSPET